MLQPYGSRNCGMHMDTHGVRHPRRGQSRRVKQQDLPVIFTYIFVEMYLRSLEVPEDGAASSFGVRIVDLNRRYYDCDTVVVYTVYDSFSQSSTVVYHCHREHSIDDR
jgi:hypothetical protein